MSDMDDYAPTPTNQEPTPEMSAPDVRAKMVDTLAGLSDVSTETLQRLAARMDSEDAAQAPQFAGAIAAVLASRLEGGAIPDEVFDTIGALGRNRDVERVAPVDGEMSSGVSP